MTTPATHRPVTSKARGVCRYYNTDRGCFAGDSCKFTHGVPTPEQQPPILTPYDQAKTCRFYASGFCKKGASCWFQHVVDLKDKQTVENEQDEDLCSICFEKPATFGLLAGCSHIFCLQCIKQWRDPNGKQGDVVESGNTKKCPMCRTPSKFITPSSIFLKDENSEKIRVIQMYKESMAKLPCKYFQQSLTKHKDKPFCPFGKDCFYQHLNNDGTPHIFKDGVDFCMRIHRSRGRNGRAFAFSEFNFDSLGASGIDLIIRHMDLTPGQRRHQERSANPNRGAERRLRQISRSLEMLNSALTEGAALNSLNAAVDALRMGFGQLESRRSNGGGPGAAGPADMSVPNIWANLDEEHGHDGLRPEEQDFEAHALNLENLADQMLAGSLGIFPGRGFSGSETPPPPLEPIDSPVVTSGRGGPPLGDQSFRNGGRESMASDDSMPDLASVSDSSDDYEGEEEESDGESYTGPTAATVDDYRFTASVGQGMGSLSVHEPQSFGASVPAVSETQEEGINNDEAVQGGDVAGTEPAEASSFMTDGRGRVVWTSPGERSTDESESSVPPPSPRTVPAAKAGFTTDGRGRVISVGTEEGTGETGTSAQTPETPSPRTSGGQSLFGRMLGAFF